MTSLGYVVYSDVDKDNASYCNGLFNNSLARIYHRKVRLWRRDLDFQGFSEREE